MAHLNALNTHLFSFLRKHPRLEIKTVYDLPSEVKKRLLSGELDLITLPRPSLADLPPCEGVVLVQDGLNILVHRGHPLFARESVGLKELAEERFVLWDRSDLPLVYDAYLAACHKEGFRPNVVATAHKLGDMVAETAMRAAVGFVNRAASYVVTPDIRLLPVSDYRDGFDVTMVRLLEDEGPHAAALLRHMAAATGQSVFRMTKKD